MGRLRKVKHEGSWARNPMLHRTGTGDKIYI